MKTFLFNPYTGQPRHPLDIQSDPSGLAIHDPAEPLHSVMHEVSAAGVQGDAARLEKSLKQTANMHHDLIVVMQAAWIEWKHGKGAEDALGWIENTLDGPGLIPDETEPWAKEAQAYFDKNRAEPFPACFCGRPSNQLWMGKGFCGEPHYKEHRAAIASQAGKGGAS